MFEGWKQSILNKDRKYLQDKFAKQWHSDIGVVESRAFAYDPEEIAPLFIDGLYIGLIYGKENIKFLHKKLRGRV